VALLGLLTLALSLCAPSAALADAYLGSTQVLGTAPTAPQATPIDTIYWQTALANGRPFRVSQPGQILQLALRGYSTGGTPEPIHFQVLRPGPGAKLTIVASSQAFTLPATDGVWPFNPTTFCVKAGDFIGFNVEGGGTGVDVFTPTTGSSTGLYAANFGTMNGNLVTPVPLNNTELLMSAFEGTGVHASPLCGGIAGIELHVPVKSLHVSKTGSAVLPLLCTGPEPCSGSLRLSVDGAVLARASFNVGSRSNIELGLSLNAAGRRMLHRAGSLAANATAILGAAPDDSVTSPLKLVG
jgi:hypothetical protein